MTFTVDDIHNLRVKMWDEYGRMSKEEARRDLRMHADSTRKAVEEIRKAKSTSTDLKSM